MQILKGTTSNCHFTDSLRLLMLATVTLVFAFGSLCFFMLLNICTLTDTCNTIDFGKKEVFTLTEVAALIRRLKSGKAADEDELRPEILKALNGEGVRWLTRVCRWRGNLKKTPKDRQTVVIIPIYKRSDRKECTNY